MKQNRLIQSIFGINNVFKGKFKLNSPLRVDGFVSGQFISSSRLHISNTGKGEGIIHAKSIEIGGQFIGDLHASDKILIRSTASVRGNIKASFLEVEEGAFYSGACFVTDKKDIRLIYKKNEKNIKDKVSAISVKGLK